MEKIKTWDEKLRFALSLPDTDLEEHATIARRGEITPCRQCFCCAAAAVIQYRSGKYRMRAPAVTTGGWDDVSWIKYIGLPNWPSQKAQQVRNPASRV